MSVALVRAHPEQEPSCFAGWYSVHVPGICAGSFWAAWWTAAPSRKPWREPDATGERPVMLGVPTYTAAVLEAEARIYRARGAAATVVQEIDPSWARLAQRRRATRRADASR